MTAATTTDPGHDAYGIGPPGNQKAGPALADPANREDQEAAKRPRSVSIIPALIYAYPRTTTFVVLLGIVAESVGRSW